MDSSRALVKVQFGSAAANPPSLPQEEGRILNPTAIRPSLGHRGKVAGQLIAKKAQKLKNKHSGQLLTPKRLAVGGIVSSVALAIGVLIVAAHLRQPPGISNDVDPPRQMIARVPPLPTPTASAPIVPGAQPPNMVVVKESEVHQILTKALAVVDEIPHGPNDSDRNSYDSAMCDIAVAANDVGERSVAAQIVHPTLKRLHGWPSGLVKVRHLVQIANIQFFLRDEEGCRQTIQDATAAAREDTAPTTDTADRSFVGLAEVAQRRLLMATGKVTCA